MPGQHTYDYAIVRVVPRVDRGEFVNAGVIVACARAGFLKALGPGVATRAAGIRSRLWRTLDLFKSARALSRRLRVGEEPARWPTLQQGAGGPSSGRCRIAVIRLATAPLVWPFSEQRFKAIGACLHRPCHSQGRWYGSCTTVVS